jgi:hypothetical protein
MQRLRLGAKMAEGTKKKTPASLPRIRLEPLGASRVATQAWKLLSDADLPKMTVRLRGKRVERKDTSEFPVPLADVAASNASHIAALEAKIGEAGPLERERLKQLLNVYQGTFGYAESLASQFTSDCGPHQTFVVRYRAAERKFRKQAREPGIAKLVEKYGLPMLGGLPVSALLERFKATDLLAGLLQSVFRRLDPDTAQWIARGAAVFLSCSTLAFLRSGASRLVKKAEGARGSVLTREAMERLGQIGRQMDEVKKAIVDLVVLEYQRLATAKSIRLGAAPESEGLIARKMVQIVLNMRERHGFELLLPPEVEKPHWEILHPPRTSRLRLVAMRVHHHLEILFGKKGGPAHFEPDGARFPPMPHPGYLAWDIDAMSA